MEKNIMISCKEYVENQKQELKEKVSKFEYKPKLCVIQVGDNQASNTYIKNKKKVADEIGITCEHIHITEDMSQEELESMITSQNMKFNVDGIIIQLPIPDKYDVEKLQRCISPEKDVDGFRRDSCFKPCTPKGIRDWLKANDFDFRGKTVTVVGRSKIVGLPFNNIAIEEGATVTCCNSSTKSLSRYLCNVDLVVSAIGKPKYFNKFDFENVGIIVDVGINRDENGKLCGDVDPTDFNRYHPNTYVTPVPNGVGRLTTLSLMKNVIEAYELQFK